MFTALFWKAAFERMIRAGAASVLSAWAVGGGILDALTLDWVDAGGIFLGGAVVSLLLALASEGLTGDGPSLTKAEIVPTDAA